MTFFLCREIESAFVPATSRRLEESTGGAVAPWTRRMASPPPPAPVALLGGFVNPSGYFWSSQLHANNGSYANFYTNVSVVGSWEFQSTDLAYLRHPVCGALCAYDDRIETRLFYGHDHCMPLSQALLYFADDDRC